MSVDVGENFPGLNNECKQSCDPSTPHIGRFAPDLLRSG